MTQNRFSRTPRNYDGIKPTGHHMTELLPGVLREIGAAFEERPDLVLAAWPEVLGEKLAPMAQAVSFHEGLLFVKVKNSTLYSLLSQRDRPRILKNLRARFPRTKILNIVFRMG